ncbi:glycosyl transferase group 1 [Pseudopedobacter saltans DSM 12145]|uniref:Glycosyl transferase group 1 n=1 Tax=Pseudopedobacter saltans (strain ATCC 51119 / DSM 12145 / JCM 21818 / CCUG 39354 / LMG 10337 / NBRC 100064 / NCIMB 13643) TaxID=762903 RepID=F0SEK1_PSESL|nr:glycosyltransferase family 4 protein [Pseudopedobacter saltans]ADY51891.1 glycosyl transferase group 1 [Pseudopedobacter saltans DSM 12145]
MNIAYISTYTPRACGLATFNLNLKNAIESNNSKDNKSFVIAINDSDNLNQYHYPEDVRFIIRQQSQKDYIKAANVINQGSADVCVMQHEFGIYGGESGVYILPMLYRINKPLITILHTVLQEPNYLQKLIIKEIAEQSARIVVMAQKAVDFLVDIYEVPLYKIELIEHGVPDYDINDANPLLENSFFKNKRTLITFGLLSRNKGLETVIKALPSIVEKHPDISYTIIGSTHPSIKASQGEEYRDSLKQLAKGLGVSDYVHFIDSFVPEDELVNYLRAAEIYITPYLNEAQITSGTLSYAVGAGCAVISTPYWHAQELLAKDRGKLFAFKSYQQLSDIIEELLSDDNKLAAIRENAYQYGLKIRYPKIGARYFELLNEISTQKALTGAKESFTIDAERLPSFNLDYVKRLTDDTGIVQHARYGIPNLKEGYCMDDNVRALIMVLMAYNQYKNKEALDLLPIYLSFIQYMQCDDGNFRNFLSFRREYLDEYGSDDSFGRTLWSLGYMVCNSPNNSYKEFSKELFFNSLKHIDNLEHIRGFANSIIGLSHYLTCNSDKEVRNRLIFLADKMVKAFNEQSSSDWHWFEDKLTYDNAILPMALLKAYEVTDEYIYKEIAFKALDFLDKETLDKGYYNPIGNDGWFYRNSKKKAIFDQQAIETMGAVMMYFQAYKVSGDVSYIKKMQQTFLWFLGENTLRVPLYDYETNGCCDGLTMIGLNRNQGAESTLAYFISYLTILQALEKEYEFDLVDKSIQYKN